MLNGWIKLHRKILDNWVSQEPELFAVWMRLLIEANHSDAKKMFNGSLVEIKRGQLIFGLPAFSAKSGVSVAKLRRYLDMLKADSMIDRQTTSKYSIITITCFDQYQLDDRQIAGKSQADDRQIAGKQQHYKNVKNVNNEKEVVKEKAKRFVPPTHDQVKGYCLERSNTVDPDRFIDHYTSNGWLVGKNKMKDWKAAVRTWEKNEKQSAPQTKVLDFPQ